MLTFLSRTGRDGGGMTTDVSWIFLPRHQDLSSNVYSDKTRYFTEKHNLFLTLTDCFFVP